MTIAAKICGIHDEPAIHAAVDGGASYVGFVLYPPSRNAITAADAQKLGRLVPKHVTKVGLIVDATDDEIRAMMSALTVDLLQLHGLETPERVATIRKMTGLPVMKALRMQKPEHLQVLPAYEAVADHLLFDSRIGREPSGGPIDWTLLQKRTFTKPWMLAGGLNAQNLAEAVRVSGATTVDVSSGVEDKPGHKSPAKIAKFLAAAARI